ncbi:adenosylcobinamide-phosphate synthase CbiB [Rhodophyticola sp.]|jgi:adenosylcobinamide-phosphate synthase|uniref:adenosylcobinamide-phosphate synthase CbiB n=1 Tax=Rhodophyticola sp. TaxID=2680032 RepID=UPI001B02DDB6|nr:cobalamin biosynthesis protein [Roseicyclus sp.]MBO6625915.1 cobalamin biosynthesis protein [Roseicyclus sp.]MBO6923482.1 cobalamin biosynthesis protein [Roseicyclus sp.]
MSLFFALLLDAILGEPRWLWSRIPHPAVLMGRAVGWCDARFNTGANRRAMGIFALAGLIGLAGMIGVIADALPLGWLWSTLGAAILLAQRSLVQHVQAVADALRYGTLPGRRAVAMIVGRDTGGMTEPEVARAAIESAAENLSDGVVAPAFWFLALGLPGILIYKIVNTADSMIGHRTARHAQFGWAAARLDDVLNWVPARLTALLIALAHGAPQAWHIARREAWRHRSPNAGWPEAAMAGVLGIALSGPRSYHGERKAFPFVNASGRHDPGPRDIDAAIGVLWRTWALMLGLVFALALF